MTKRTQTILTIQVKLDVPENSNAAQIMEYIRNAIRSHKGGMDPEHPLYDWPSIEHDDFTVKLVKKETLYGSA